MARGKGEGSITEDKRRGTWTAEIKLNGIRHKKSGLPNQKAGVQYIDQVKREAHDSDGVVVQPSKVTYGQWLDQWEAILARRVRMESMSRTTYDSYRKNIRLHIRPILGPLPVQKINPKHLTDLYDKLLAEGSEGGNGPLSIRTVAYIHTIIQASMRDAITQTPPLRRQNPCALIPKDDVPRAATKANQGEYDVFEPDQIVAFTHYYRDHRLVALWWLYFTRGARRGEILALRWSNVNLEAGYLELVRNRVVVKKDGDVGKEIIERNVTKNGTGRVVPLDPFLVGVLREHKKRQEAERVELSPAGRWEDTDYVFVGDGKVGWSDTGIAGRPLNPDHLSRTFQRMIANYNKAHPEAPLPVIRLHDTRHTTATHLILSGVDENVVAELLGHAPGVTRMIYTHVSRKRAAMAAAALTQLVIGKLPQEQPATELEPAAERHLRVVQS